MDCRELIERLDEFIAGAMRPSERRAAEEHLTSCNECRDLHLLLADGLDERGVEPPPGLLESVLSRTSGGTCRSAHRLLCGHVDGELEAVDDELLRLHLNDCAGCAGVAQALVQMSSDLPELAELRPDDEFVDDVLARTTRREKFAIGWAARLAEGWQRLMQRPRFAFEGAYLGLIISVLLFGVPNSPLADVPERALDLVRSNPVAGLSGSDDEDTPRIRITLRPQWPEKGAELAGATREFADDVARRSSSVLDDWKKDLGTLWDRLASQESSVETNGTANEADRIEGEE